MATSLGAVRDTLGRAGLIPPVKGVEQGGGGWVHVLVPEPISDDLRSCIAEALNDLGFRWTLREQSASTDYR